MTTIDCIFRPKSQNFATTLRVSAHRFARMTLELFTALATFALVTVITPGPNNLMLMASGANFGFRRTIPHMLGIGLGFPAMVLLVGVGVMQVFDLWPVSYVILKVLSVSYLLYLAWKIANAAPPADAEGTAEGRPLTFVQSAAFQWVNPKAWSMALSAITLYAASRDLAAVLWVAGTYVGVSAVSTTSWTVLGQQLRRLLRRPGRLRAFNWVMAALLVATLVPVLWPGGS
jgi:threonine/homoserine/homoserine lactone efflux protein